MTKLYIQGLGLYGHHIIPLLHKRGAYSQKASRGDLDLASSSKLRGSLVLRHPMRNTARPPNQDPAVLGYLRGQRTQVVGAGRMDVFFSKGIYVSYNCIS